MKPFGWGRMKGTRPATRIALEFISSTDDMLVILAHWAHMDTDERCTDEPLGRFHVEQIIRRAYQARGESAHSMAWIPELPEVTRQRVFRWARKQLAHAFPHYYLPS